MFTRSGFSADIFTKAVIEGRNFTIIVRNSTLSLPPRKNKVRYLVSRNVSVKKNSLNKNAWILLVLFHFKTKKKKTKKRYSGWIWYTSSVPCKNVSVKRFHWTWAHLNSWYLGINLVISFQKKRYILVINNQYWWNMDTSTLVFGWSLINKFDIRRILPLLYTLLPVTFFFSQCRRLSKNRQHR